MRLLTYGFCQEQIMISIGFYVWGLIFIFLEVKQLSLSDCRRSGFHFFFFSFTVTGRNPFWFLFSNKQPGLIIPHACKQCLHTNIGFELHRPNVTQQIKHKGKPTRKDGGTRWVRSRSFCGNHQHILPRIHNSFHCQTQLVWQAWLCSLLSLHLLPKPFSEPWTV